MRWLTLTGAVLCEVMASLSLKASESSPAWLAIVASGYIAAFAFLAMCLRQGMQIGVAYGIWGAAGVVLTAVLSAVIFAEPFTPMMGVGIAFIIVGVLLVELGSHSKAPESATREEVA